VLGGHKAAAVAAVLRRVTVYLVSDLPDELVRRCGMVPCAGLDTALVAALDEMGPGANLLVLPQGGSILPLVQHRFKDSLKRRVARLVVQQALRFGYTTIGTVGNVIPGSLGIFLGNGGAPLFKGHKAQVSRLAEPGGHCLGVTAQGQSRRRDDVKTLPDGAAPVVQRFPKRLGHILRMDVMHGLHPQIRERQLFSARQFLKNHRVEIAGRIHDNPARSHDVTRMQHGGRETVPARLIQQVRLDGGLVDAVLPKGTPGLLFGGGHAHTVSVDPDGAANDEMLHLAAQRLHQRRALSTV
jgi:hypothetical protein